MVPDVSRVIAGRNVRPLDPVPFVVVFVVERAVAKQPVVSSNREPATHAVAVLVVFVFLVGQPGVVRFDQLMAVVVIVSDALARIVERAVDPVRQEVDRRELVPLVPRVGVAREEVAGRLMSRKLIFQNADRSRISFVFVEENGLSL